jgi:hypothetical protein
MADDTAYVIDEAVFPPNTIRAGDRDYSKYDEITDVTKFIKQNNFINEQQLMKEDLNDQNPADLFPIDGSPVVIPVQDNVNTPEHQAWVRGQRLRSKRHVSVDPYLYTETSGPKKKEMVEFHQSVRPKAKVGGETEVTELDKRKLNRPELEDKLKHFEKKSDEAANLDMDVDEPDAKKVPKPLVFIPWAEQIRADLQLLEDQDKQFSQENRMKICVLFGTRLQCEVEQLGGQIKRWQQQEEICNKYCSKDPVNTHICDEYNNCKLDAIREKVRGTLKLLEFVEEIKEHLGDTTWDGQTQEELQAKYDKLTAWYLAQHPPQNEDNDEKILREKLNNLESTPSSPFADLDNIALHWSLEQHKDNYRKVLFRPPMEIDEGLAVPSPSPTF